MQNGDPIKLDMNNRTLNLMISKQEYKKRLNAWWEKQRIQSHYPESQTPWQEMYRRTVLPLSEGSVMDFATKYRKVARKKPRHNH